ncbi:unnamed protein product [Symbiodinium sp. CCMP2592]|nr:unnamed protein product [Symbiodinium sp. CCMP2592]
MAKALTVPIIFALIAQAISAKNATTSSCTRRLSQTCPNSTRPASQSPCTSVSRRPSSDKCCCPDADPVIWSDAQAKCTEPQACIYSCCPGGTRYCDGSCCTGACGLVAGNLKLHCCVEEGSSDCCADHRSGTHCQTGRACCLESLDPKCLEVAGKCPKPPSPDTVLIVTVVVGVLFAVLASMALAKRCFWRTARQLPSFSELSLPMRGPRNGRQESEPSESAATQTTGSSGGPCFRCNSVNPGLLVHCGIPCRNHAQRRPICHRCLVQNDRCSRCRERMMVDEVLHDASSTSSPS